MLCGEPNNAVSTTTRGKRFEGDYSRSTWESILKLSAYPPFDDWKLRELAIVEIEAAFVKESVPLVDRLVLGQQLQVAQWVTCAGEELVRRDSPLTEDEITFLGDKTSLKLTTIDLRSRIWRDELPQRDRAMYNFWDAVLTEFGDELSKDKTYKSWSDYTCECSSCRVVLHVTNNRPDHRRHELC